MTTETKHRIIRYFVAFATLLAAAVMVVAVLGWVAGFEIAGEQPNWDEALFAGIGTSAGVAWLESYRRSERARREEITYSRVRHPSADEEDISSEAA